MPVERIRSVRLTGAGSLAGIAALEVLVVFFPVAVGVTVDVLDALVATLVLLLVAAETARTSSSLPASSGSSFLLRGGTRLGAMGPAGAAPRETLLPRALRTGNRVLRFGDAGIWTTGSRTFSGVAALTFRARLRVFPEVGLSIGLSVNAGSSRCASLAASAMGAARPPLRSEDRVTRGKVVLLPSSSVSEVCTRLEPLAAPMVLGWTGENFGESFGERVVIVTSSASGVRARVGREGAGSVFSCALDSRAGGVDSAAGVRRRPERETCTPKLAELREELFEGGGSLRVSASVLGCRGALDLATPSTAG